MKFVTMLSDVWASLRKKPVTEKYPFERREAPSSLRGLLLYDPSSCTGCGLCAKDCPADAIESIVLDKKAKRFVMRYHVDRCTFCAQCVNSCRQDCIKLANDIWELAALDKENFELYYGNDVDIKAVLDGVAGGDAGKDKNAEKPAPAKA